MVNDRNSLRLVLVLIIVLLDVDVDEGVQKNVMTYLSYSVLCSLSSLSLPSFLLGFHCHVLRA